MGGKPGGAMGGSGGAGGASENTGGAGGTGMAGSPGGGSGMGGGRPSGDARMLVSVDYETGDFSQWQGCSECEFSDQNLEIVTKNVFQGKYAARITQVDKRTEPRSEKVIPMETDFWYGGAFYLEKFAVSHNRGDLMQIHGYPCDTPIHFHVRDGQWGVQIEKAQNNDLKPMQLGHWYELVANMKLTHQNHGYIRFWLDGELLFDYKGPTFGACDGNGYLKVGTYAMPNGNVVLHDAQKIAINAKYADVDP